MMMTRRVVSLCRVGGHSRSRRVRSRREEDEEDELGLVR
jgi:hypothetical protein